MAAPVIKQIRGTVKGIIFIVIGSILAAIVYGGTTGELKEWHDLRGIAEHGLFASVCLVAGWILLKSPFAPEFQTFLSSAKTTDAEGNVTEAHLEISGPPPVAGASKTTVIDPANAKVTIKENTPNG